MILKVENKNRGKFKNTMVGLVKQIDHVKVATTKMIQLRIELQFGIQKPDNVVLLTGITCSRLFQFFATKAELKAGMDMIFDTLERTDVTPSYAASVEASWKIIQEKRNKDKSKKRKPTAEETRLKCEVGRLTRQRDDLREGVKRITTALERFHEAEDLLKMRQEEVRQETEFVRMQLDGSFY